MWERSWFESRAVQARKKSRLFGRLALASAGVALVWFAIAAVWFPPPFMIPAFLLLFAAVVFAIQAWAWAIQAVEDEPPHSATGAGKRLLHASAVLTMLVLGGIGIWLAVDGLVTGEIATGRTSTARREEAPLRYWLYETLHFTLAAWCFYTAFYWRRKPRIRQW